MIDFRCTNCGKLLRTGPETAGKRAKCPDCGTLLTIPMAPGTAPAMPGGALPAGGMPPARPPVHQEGPAVNPFQSPQAPLGGVSPAVAGPIAPATLDMNDLFSTTWAVFKANLGMAILLPLVVEFIVAFVAIVAVMVVMAVMAQSAFLGAFLGLITWAGLIALSAAVGVGLLKAYLKLARGQPVTIGEVFKFGPELVPFILTQLLLSAVVSVGFVCCIVPGYILAVMFSQCLFLVADRNVGIVDSFTQSKDLTNGNKLTIFLTWFLASLAAPFAVICTCGIGMFLVGPFMILLACVIHLRITSQPIAVPVQ